MINWVLFELTVDLQKHETPQPMQLFFSCSGETEKGGSRTARETVSNSKTQRGLSFIYRQILIHVFYYSRVPSKDSSPDTTKQQLNNSQAEIGEL